MAKFNYKNPYVIGSVILVLGISGYFLYFYLKKKRIIKELETTNTAITSSNTTKTGTTSKTSTGGTLVTGHDAIWDYLYENGIWFTRKKGSTSWINMKDNLSTENYSLAVSRLSKYI